jgi:hypothetical protein
MYCLFCDPVGVSDGTALRGSIIGKKELERILKEAVVTYFEYGFSICVKGRKETTKI